MHLIKNINLKNKLILILVVPMIGMVVFSYMLYQPANEAAENAARMAQLTRLAVVANRSVDHLQDELDTTAQFIKARGKLYGQALKNLHRKSDQVIEEFTSTLDTMDVQAFDEVFAEHVNDLLAEMAELAATRESIMQRELNGRKAETFYSKLVDDMLGLIEMMPRLSFDKELANASNAYVNFMRLKNYAAKERYILFNVFERDQFVGKEFEQFNRAVNNQQVYLRAFLSLASPQQQAMYEEKLQGQSITTAMDMRQKAFLSADYGAFSINPQEWMITQGHKIKLLNDIAETLTADISNKVVSKESDAARIKLSLSMFSLFALILTIIFWWIIARGIGDSVSHILHVMHKISQGDLGSDTSNASRDEFGQLITSLGKMQADLKCRIDREAVVAAQNLRVKQALDHVTANVMLADEDNQIIYLNDAALNTFSNIETDLADEIHGFRASDIIGSSIDKFHKHPQHQQQLVAGLSQSHQASIAVGGRSMNFVANPVIDASGKRLGTVVEWLDRTDEVRTEIEIQTIVDAVQQGDLNQRIKTDDKTGFNLNLSNGINEMVREISSTLEDINGVMSALASGDLTKSISNDYRGTFADVASNVNHTIEQIGQIVGEIRSSANTVNSNSREILEGNNYLSSRTEQQAAALEETASSLEELTSTVKQNSDSAQRANSLATTARDIADKGGQVVEEAIQAMQEINTSSKKISEIISVIDEIAFQTNLLALNASVEAARAGEQGRGFAVVATEVRNLAQRSATAAKEIKELIQDSVAKVNSGSELVNRSGETLTEIVHGINKVGDIVSDIAAASQEQTLGIEQVNAAVSSIDETTQQNASLAEQTMSSSVAMSERAGDMKQRLDFFSLGSQWQVDQLAVADEQQATETDSTGLNPSIDKPIPADHDSELTQLEPLSPTEAEQPVTPIEMSFDDEDWEEF
ncbi:MAG: methyl-accepting chemotaxis protein [Gammaproteobacteria bacterium]|nr:methyl-accepting chemotaxis protein [Gammaproteobacteria bacterium]